MSRRRAYRDDYDSRYHDTRRRTRPPTASENRRYRVQRTSRGRYDDEYIEARRRRSRYDDYYDEDEYYDDNPTLFERILTRLTSGKKKKNKSEEKVIVCNNVKFDSAIIDGFYELVCKIKADAEDTSDGGAYDSEQ